MEINSGKQQDIQSIIHEAESLAASFSQYVPEGKPYRQIAKIIVGEMLSATRKDENYISARGVIEAHQQQTNQLKAALDDMLAALDRMEKVRSHREKYSAHWWDKTHKELIAAFSADPEDATQQWILLYVHALTDWELETCQKLIDTPFPFQQAILPYMQLFHDVDEIIQKADFRGLLQMLEYLLEHLTSRSSEQQRILIALLEIFVGRIYLYKIKIPERAREAFERAATLAPQDGRPLAALGELSMIQEEAPWANANRHFFRAIELSPDQPEGYIGKAMLAEAKEQWSEADDWYKEAVHSALDERNLVRSLSRFLAPGSGRLYVHAAKQLLTDQKPDQALLAINQAISLSFNDGTDYPLRIVHALKGQILEMLALHGEISKGPDSAAETYFMAGQQYYWSNEFSQAVQFFRKAKQLNYTDASLYWYLSDALCILSYTPEPPYVNKNLILKSLAVWNKGMATRPSFEESSSWALLVRTDICEQLAKLPGQNGHGCLWEALVYVERAMLYKEDNLRWTKLSDLYDAFSLYINALHAIENSLNIDPDQLEVDSDNQHIVAQKVRILLNSGELKAAEGLLQKLMEAKEISQNDLSVYKGWQAFSYYYQKKFREGINCINQTLEVSPDDLWSRSIRAKLYLKQGEYELARQDNEWIWRQRHKSMYEGHELTFAWTAYFLNIFDGKDSAIGHAEPLLRIREEAQEAAFLIGLAYLVQGNWMEADQYLSKALILADNLRVIQDMKIEIEYLENTSTNDNWSNKESLHDFFNKPGGLKDKTKQQNSKIEKTKQSPTEEIESFLKDDKTCQAGHCSWIAAQAALGRLYLEQGDYMTAIQAYQRLNQYPNEFPEAIAGVKKALKAIMDKGDQLLKEGKSAEALVQYKHLLSAGEDRSIINPSGLHGRLALGYFLLGETSSAQTHYLEAINLHRSDGTSGNTLKETWNSLIPGSSQFWTLWDDLHSLETSPDIDQDLRTTLADTRNALTGSLDRLYGLDKLENELNISVVTPLVLEVGEDIVPKVDSRSDGGKFLYEDIPAMRERIEKDTGVKVTGVRARGMGSTGNRDQFVIQLDEIPVIKGSVKVGKGYYPASSEVIRQLGIPFEEIITAPNPWTAEEGCWISFEYQDKIPEADLELWTETLYIIYQLEVILRRNLANFLGIQEVETILESHAETAEGKQQITSVLPDRQARVHFARLLRTLVKENTPISNIGEILQAFRELQLNSVNLDHAVRQIRLRNKSILPGNQSGVQRFELPPVWEEMVNEWVRVVDRKTKFTPPPDKAHNLIQEIDRLVPSPNRNSVLVVNNHQTRPFLRRLLENRFPDLMVMSAEELVEVTVSEDESKH